VVPGEMNTDEGTLAAEFRLPSAMVTRLLALGH